MENEMMRNGRSFIFYTIFIFIAIKALPSMCDEEKPWQGDDRHGLIITQSDLILKINLHNLWLNSKGRRGKKLNLSMANLSGVDFAGITLKWAKLDGVNLQGANLNGAKLQGVKLRDANLQKASLVGTNLKWAYLQGVNLQLANLSNADLEGADLRNVNLQWAILNGANLQWAIMREANLQGAKLKNADLHKANLLKANMQWARLDNASLKWANLDSVNLERAILRDANLTWAILVNANLKYAKLMGANLKGAKIDKANLRNSNLEGANLQWSDLAGASLQHATFKSTNLSGADLKNATFFKTIFEITPNELPNIKYLSLAKHLHFLTYAENPYSLFEIRNAFKRSGLKQQEREITYAVQHKRNMILKTHPKSEKKLIGYIKWLLFDVTCRWGMKPERTLFFLFSTLLFFSIFYIYTLYGLENNTEIWRVEHIQRIHANYYGNTSPSPRLELRSSFITGIYTTISAFLILLWGQFKIQTVMTGENNHCFLRASWHLRSICAIQSILSIYFLILYLVTFFGRPFG